MRISDWSSDVCSSDLKEGFDLSGEWYLPDFYLADFPMWFEVKPDETDGSEQDVFKKLCKETKTPGIIAYGSPSPRQCNLLRVSDEGQIIGKDRKSTRLNSSH